MKFERQEFKVYVDICLFVREGTLIFKNLSTPVKYAKGNMSGPCGIKALETSNILIKMVFNRTASSKNFICDNEKLVTNKESDQGY